MKRNFIHIIFSVCLSGMFLLAGTGYNLTHYCCNDCKNAGIEVVAEMSCENIHEQHCHDESTTHTHSKAMDACNHSLTKGCDIERLTVDIPSLNQPSQEITDYVLMVADLDDFQTSLALAGEISLENNSFHTPQKNPVPLPGRLILSQKSVLII